MKEILVFIAKSLVDNPDAVTVTEEQKDDTLVLKLQVAQSDMGKVIGKSGRIAKAIRTVLKAQAVRDDVRVNLDID